MTTEQQQQEKPRGIEVHAANQIRKAVDEKHFTMAQLEHEKKEREETLKELKRQKEEVEKARKEMEDLKRKVELFEGENRSKLLRTAEKLQPYLDDLAVHHKNNHELKNRIETTRDQLMENIKTQDISPGSQTRAQVEILTAAASSQSVTASKLQEYIKREQELLEQKVAAEEKLKTIEEESKTKLESYQSEQDELLKKKDAELLDLMNQLDNIKKKYDISQSKISNTDAHVEKSEGSMEVEKETQQAATGEIPQNTSAQPIIQGTDEIMVAAASSENFDDYQGFSRLYDNLTPDYSGSWRNISTNITPDLYARSTIREYTDDKVRKYM